MFRRGPAVCLRGPRTGFDGEGGAGAKQRHLTSQLSRRAPPAVKFSLQTAALWITQLRCARSKIGQLREPTNGHGKEARSASREPIRMGTSFQGTYLEKEESRHHFYEDPNKLATANYQFFSLKRKGEGRGQGRQGRVKKGLKLYSVYIPPALEFLGPGANGE